jgi:SAM-dependent methyltransferase
VAPSGKAIGVDMTPQMVTRARDNAVKGGFDNVEFREGRLETLPVDDASVDAVTSNCVINLVPDKSRVFREIARVLKPGGRMVISDIVLDGELPGAVKNDLLSYVGCVSGAEQRKDYFAMVEAAGLTVSEVLEDTDVVAVGCEVSPDQVQSFAGRSGTSVDELKGKVRSVTYRAVK